MKDEVSCDGIWVLLSDDIVSETPYLLNNRLKAFMRFTTSQMGNNPTHIVLEEAQEKR